VIYVLEGEIFYIID